MRKGNTVSSEKLNTQWNIAWVAETGPNHGLSRSSLLVLLKTRWLKSNSFCKYYSLNVLYFSILHCLWGSATLNRLYHFFSFSGKNVHFLWTPSPTPKVNFEKLKHNDCSIKSTLLSCVEKGRMGLWSPPISEYISMLVKMIRKMDDPKYTSFP